MSVKLLTEHNLEFLSLKGGFTGSYESTLIKVPHSWKSHANYSVFSSSATEGVLFMQVCETTCQDVCNIHQH